MRSEPHDAAVATAPHPPEPDFQEIMAEQLRHAPWLGLSIALHGLAVLVVYLLPAEQQQTAKRVMHLQPPTPPTDIEKATPPEIEPIPEETTDEPVLLDARLTEVTESPSESFSELPPTESTSSAFDSDAWNTAIGLGSGAAGPHGGRGDGRALIGRSGHRAEAAAIGHALEWLKLHQDLDGRWDADDFMKHDTDGEPCDGPGNPVHDIGLTGLALLAFLGDGSTLRSGPYRDVVKRAVGWLRQQQDPDTGQFGTNNSNEFIYNHAIATLAMVEAYGLSDSRILAANAQGGIHYLEYHRNPYSVWRYQPRDGDNDTSVTGWAVMAYKSAQDFGLEVNAQALTLAEAWFDQMTDPVSGRTGYTERGGLSSRRTGDHAVHFPREAGECMTAVSLLCRFFLGKDPKQDKLMPRQADLILANAPKWDEQNGSIDHYYWYYGTYALYQFGGRPWSRWEKTLEKAVVDPQRRDGNNKGSWDPAGVWGEDGGRVYSTALLCLTLEAYYRYTRLVH